MKAHLIMEPMSVKGGSPGLGYRLHGYNGPATLLSLLHGNPTRSAQPGEGMPR